MTIICADVMDWAAEYEGEPHHAMLCDPPYELGFMSAKWDKTGISYRKETWAALAQHLHPGAFIMAFASTRGFHRQAVAMEDAGLIMHPFIAWSFGCLSEDTEILTPQGWQSYTRLLVGDMVMGYNVDTDSIEPMEVEEVFTYEYSDTAYRIRSDTTDQIVSRSHRCLVERGGDYVFRKAETLKRKETVPVLETMPSLRQSLYSQGQRSIPQEENVWGEVFRLEAELFKGIPAPGACYSMPGMRQRKVQTGGASAKSENPDMLQAMQRGFEEQRVDQALSQRAGGVDGGVSQELLGKDDRPKQPRLEGWRNLPQPQGKLSGLQDQVCALPREVPQHGPQGWIRYGASPTGGASDRPSAYTPGVRTPHRSQPGKQHHRQSDVIHQQRRSQELRGQRATRPTLATVTPIHYEGVVWCVKVRSGAFVARRNGKAFVTGNSGFPKATRVKDAPAFEGHRYGRQALKPAIEPILVFQKPYEGRPVDNIVRTGAGSLWIDGGRIGVGSERDSRGDHNGDGGLFKMGSGMAIGKTTQGRWPANFILQHSPGCQQRGTRRVRGSHDGKSHNQRRNVAGMYGPISEGSVIHTDPDGLETVADWACVEGCSVLALARQSGESAGGKERIATRARNKGWANSSPGAGVLAKDNYGDKGSAARFFKQVSTRLDEADPFYYQAKASRSEREAGLVAEDAGQRANQHPTVKPIALAQYLATLLLPPVEYAPRRLLNPFTGSGSEMIGASLAGWEHITGIELSEEYCEIARARLAYWRAQIPKLVQEDFFDRIRGAT